MHFWQYSVAQEVSNVFYLVEIVLPACIYTTLKPIIHIIVHAYCLHYATLHETDNLHIH